MSNRFRYWLPPTVWTVLILLASSDLFSAAHTGLVLQKILAAIFGTTIGPETFEEIHFFTRKIAHLTEYGILGALLFRALRAGRGRWSWRWAATAVVIAACVASMDEWHQTFVPSRTGSPLDVMIDTIGATAAQLLIRAMQMLFFRS